MPEKKFMKTFRNIKIAQLCVLLILDIGAIVVLLANPGVGKRLFEDKVVFLLYCIIWALMVFGLLCLLYDFFKIKQFAVESHALNKVAYLDNLTGIPNRHGLDSVFKTYDTPESMTTVGCFMVTLANLKEINESKGHAAGDLMIQDFCNIFEEIGDTFGFVGRNGGNDYLMVMDDCSHEAMERFILALDKRVEAYNGTHTEAPIRIRHTYLLNTEEKAKAFTQLLTATYNKLHS